MTRRRRGANSPGRGHVGLEQRLLARLKRLDPAADRPILVGFSAGSDSLALAAALGRVAPVVGAAIELLHVDHRLRPTSRDEASRARSLARHLGLPCTVVALEPSAISGHQGTGVEEAARRERYQVFAEQVQRHDAAAVALAHHQSDQAETVLLHLLRGAGVHGASGIAELSTLTVPWWDDERETHPIALTVWRPLLTEPRSVLRAYAATLGLKPIEDPSNDETGFRRNAIRHDILPMLARVSPGATASLARYAELAASADRFLQEQAERILDAARVDEHRLAIAPLRDAHPAIQRTVLHAWLAGQGLEPTLERVDALLRLVSRPSAGRAIEVGRGRSVSVVDRVLVSGLSNYDAGDRE